MRSASVAPRRQVRRVLGVAPYVAAPALSALAPIAIIPAITVSSGVAVWSSIAIAQAVGAAAAIFVELGWGVTGPQAAAAAGPRERKELYKASLISKVLPFLVLSPAAGAIAWALAPVAHVEAAIVAVAGTAVALGQSWYFVGIGRPRDVLVTDTVPRVVLTLGAAMALLAGAPVLVYAVAIVLAALVTTMLGWAKVRPGHVSLRAAPGVTRAAWRQQKVVGAGRVFGALYTALPVALLGAVDSGAVAVFSAGDKLLKFGLSLLAGFPARLQSWVGVATGSERIRRAKQSIALSMVLGVGSAVVYVALAPWATSLLFAGEVHLPRSLAALFALTCALVCTSRAFGLALVSARATNSITVATVAAGLLGAPAILVLGAHLGATGAALGQVAAEVTGVAVQAVLLAKAMRSISAAPSSRSA